MSKVASKLNKNLKVSRKNKTLKIKMRKPLAAKRKARAHKARKKVQEKIYSTPSYRKNEIHT